MPRSALRSALVATNGAANARRSGTGIEPGRGILGWAVAARPDEEVLSGLEAACGARRLIDLGQTYQFTHDVVRDVVEADIGSARRVSLHRRAGKRSKCFIRRE